MSNEAFLSIPIKVRNNLYIKDPLGSVLNVISTIRSNVDFIVLGSHSGIEFDKHCSGKDCSSPSLACYTKGQVPSKLE